MVVSAFHELWKDKETRLRKSSPFGSHPNWGIQAVIVKSGDDLRQEQLAIQLIHTIHNIFKEADIPLWYYLCKIEF
jgi:phosphatidylinositol kinase/protein kinase (PI-3  family)